jgi:protein TonB
MKRLRRPGYLAGYAPFGQTKGGTEPVPQPPPPAVTQHIPPPPVPAPPPPRPATPTAPALRPAPAGPSVLAAPQPAGPTPAQRADPAFMARIAALQRQVRGGPIARPGLARPLPGASPRSAPRPTADDDDED